MHVIQAQAVPVRTRTSTRLPAAVICLCQHTMIQIASSSDKCRGWRENRDHAAHAYTTACNVSTGTFSRKTQLSCHTQSRHVCSLPCSLDTCQQHKAKDVQSQPQRRAHGAYLAQDVPRPVSNPTPDATGLLPACI